MPSLSSVVARSYPGNIIGIDNKLPWRLKSDLQFFKKTTLGHTVIMGRRTYESIGRPLPGRTNIILSREEPIYIKENSLLKWAPSVETALFMADVETIISGKKEFFIIGGEQVYKAFHHLINKVYLTEVFCGNINGDASFDVQFETRTPSGEKGEWLIVKETEFPKSEDDQYPFRITEYRRRKPQHRDRLRDEFIRLSPDFRPILHQYELTLQNESENEAEQLPLFE